MLCSPPTSLKQREPDDLLPHNPPQPSRAAGSFSVKSFGRREAYESPRRTNPRSAGEGLWGFQERLMSASP